MSVGWYKKYEQYVGLPYEKPLGCFRLVQRIYKEQFDVNMPDFVEGLDDTDYLAKAKVFKKALGENCIEVHTPKEGDIIVFKDRNHPSHIGIVLQNKLMIHAPNVNETTRIERYNSLLWRNRIEGFYRYITQS